MSNLLDTKTVFTVNGEEVKLTGNIVKQFLASGNADITDKEIVMFINLCKFQKLNPFLNEAYLIKFKGSPAQIVVSKEAFMKRANADKNFNGLKAGIMVERNNEIVELEGAVKLSNDLLIGGWAEVYRKDREYPYVVKISLDEFGKTQATWKSMPANMIRKTAIVNALREAFPEQLGSMYTEEEQQAAPRDVTDVQQEIRENENKQLIDIPSSSDPIVIDKATAVEVTGEVIENKVSNKDVEVSEAQFTDVSDFEDDLF